MKKTLTLTYPQGLHARPSTALFHLLKDLDCKVWISHEGHTVDAADVLSVLSCGIQSGDVEFEAKGADAEKALTLVEEFFHKLNTDHQW